MTIAKDGPRLPSVQVADALRKELQEGAYAPEEKLPSIKALADRFGIAEETVKKGLATLRTEGLIFSVPNRGHFAVGSDRESDAAVNSPDDVRESIDALRSEVQKLSARVAQLEKKSDPGDA
ncbi:winged helix-turn-helix domain-containing protein [Streptomyces sp. NBC_01198]|uniref:winged helix-turn-helix domain-containing protein n=1 Tax=Streptomyces sp. NBC_01198 TaxID=2903769 RepID=UPI002E0EB1DD|nr:winged helix-turn-helix domain-containing protein [Streptomyces sp. NBC_01198]